MANRHIPLLLAFLLAGCITQAEIPQAPDSMVTAGPSQEPLPEPLPEPETPEPDITIPLGPSPEEMAIGNQTAGKLLLTEIEQSLFRKVNEKREDNGLAPLLWAEGILPAARIHSLSLAEENLLLTEPALFCKRPFIHHEGFDIGLYAVDRLYNQGVYGFASLGENLFIAPTYGEALTYDDPEACPEESLIADYSAESVQEGYEERLAYVENASRVTWGSIVWKSREEIEDDIVDGWMDSEGHRANILEQSFDQSAIGVAQVNDYIVVTQLFIDGVDCGYLDAQCCLEDDMLYCYDPWTCQDYYCE